MSHLPAGIPVTPLMERLRDATCVVRDREPLGGRVSWLDYRMYLFRLYGFHVVIEHVLRASRQVAMVVPDAAMRNHKAALLAHDLIALRVEPRELAQLPRMTFATSLALPEALGWTYVIESTVLGGKQLARHLARQIPAEIQIASAYLGCYGDEAPERWRQLGAAIDRCEQAGCDGDRMIAAARDGFFRLRAWVRPSVQPQPSRIHA
jgi:heme oxygenase